MIRTSIALAFAMLPISVAAAGEITDREFQSLHAELQQPADAVWRSVPWKISLLEAQEESVAQNKPIFIWAMDGHPLGCT